jgi:hypothetical protein
MARRLAILPPPARICRFSAALRVAVDVRREGAAPGQHAAVIPITGAGFALIALGICWFVLTRLSLLHTHVAIGGTLRIREVWTDTRGHCWSICLIQLCAGVPTFAVHALVAASGLASLHTFGTPATALSDLGALYIGAPCSAWLYRRYANTLKASLPR